MINQRPHHVANNQNIVNNNVVINNNTNVHNHQQVFNNFNRPGNGWGYNGNRPNYNRWGDYWHDQHIHHHHHGWYHGAWGGPWSTVWSGPFAFGYVGWGSSNFLYSSGYVHYYNPYATQVVIVEGIDYSRPIVVQQVVQTVNAQPALEPGLRELDDARALFRVGRYQEARARSERALQLRPGDPAAHEFYALCLFALGDYQPAAAVLNALLASSPGWDWATMSRLYDATASYERQLRTLEAASIQEPDDISKQFVLGYHYLVCGHTERALVKLNHVHELQPKDMVAAKLVATLEQAKQPQPEALPEERTPITPKVAEVNPPQLSEPGDVEAEAAPVPSPPEEGTEPAATPAEPENPTEEVFDLVGTWISDLPQGGKVTLTITEDSGFVWRVQPPMGEVKEIKGTLSSANDLLVLESPKDGTMIGRAAVKETGKFAFVLQGGPPNDPGLIFSRELEKAENLPESTDQN